MHAIGHHWHALQRDLLNLGFRAADMFTPKLTASELVSLIAASPPGSALRYAIEEGWSTSDHLLATDMEFRAGLISLPGRFRRPGALVEVAPKDPSQIVFKNVAEFEAHRAKVMKAKRNG